MTTCFVFFILFLILGYCLIAPRSDSYESFQLGEYDGYHWTTPFELSKVPAMWDKRQISIEGVYLRDNNVSVFNDTIWVTLNPNVIIDNQPQENMRSQDIVRLSGTFHHIDGQKYGYQGRYQSEIEVDKIMYCQHIKSRDGQFNTQQLFV